ncbi:spore coat protein YlbD [Fictibacillus sp. Mic-4]|uniref:spore coat protein YlbD n=1 Tax=Fictibacillus TaxID=1329200 RepID=UPI00047B6862|nr:spore coat protein YlbD [Fictibacillus gelatini]
MKKDIEEFRQFVLQHPKLIHEVRAKKRTWKEVYQDWIVLGDKHESWNQYRASRKKKTVQNEKEAVNKKIDVQQENDSKDKKGKTLGDFFSIIREVNISDLQQHIGQISGAIEEIQRLLSYFQSNQPASNERQTETHSGSHPFHKD